MAAETSRRSAEFVAQRSMDRKMLDRDSQGRPALVDDFSTQARKANEKQRLAKRHEGFVHQAEALNSQNLLP